jgi:hypothetical protein
VVSPLAQRDLEQPAPAAERPNLDMRRMDHTILERDPLPRLIGGRFDRSAHGRLVNALNAVARMGEAMGGIPVRGEEEDAFGQHVEPANVGQPRDVGDQLEYRAPAPRISLRRQDARRLVQNEPLGSLLSHVDRAVIYANLIVRRVHRLPNAGDDAVDGDATGLYEPF